MMHYERLRTHGSYDAPHLATAEARFWSKVDKSQGCWEWHGTKNADGYGMFSIGRPIRVLAHRHAWALLVGPIPEGKQLDHQCHNPACVNPAHLREVSNKENHEHFKGAFSTSKTGIRGVSWDKFRCLWKATVTHNYKQHLVGRYATTEEAEAAVIAKRLELFTHNNVDRAAA